MSESVQTQVVRRCSSGGRIPRREWWSRAVLPLGLAWFVLAGCSDIPQVSVQLSGPAITSEASESVSLHLSLAARPRGVVTIEAFSSDLSEGSVSAPVTFDAEDWRTPRIITVTGVDDWDDDGEVAYAVRLLASSSRATDEEPVEVGVFSFVNRDNEVASFLGLGDLPGGLVGSYVTDINPSGNMIVGDSEGPAGRQATRWGLSMSAVSNEVSHAEGVSPDGIFVAGSIAHDPFSGGFWWGSGPFVSVYQPNPGTLAPVGVWMLMGVAALDDGQVIGNCRQYGFANAGFDCRFVPPDRLEILASMTYVYGADSAGNRVGTRLPSRYEVSRYGSLAQFNERQLPFPEGTCSIPHRCRAEARALTTGGGVIVGNVSVPPAEESGLPADALVQTAFVYTGSEGMLRLPDLADGENVSSAYAVTEDGNVIGGFGNDSQGARAVLWIDRVPLTVEEVLANAGSSAPEGWRLLDVQDFSADGRILVGNALNPDGNPEAYRIDFPSPLVAAAVGGPVAER